MTEPGEKKAEAEEVPGSGVSDDDVSEHAADDPTDMWDEAALRAAGLGDILAEHSDRPPAQVAAPVITSVETDLPESRDTPVSEAPKAPTSVEKQPSTLPPAAKQGLSWPLVIGLAVALGVAVFFAVRFLR